MNLGLLALTLPFAVAAPAPYPAPLSVASPFTFVKVLGPTGSMAMWYPAMPSAVSTDGRTVVGLRPGYTYRFALTNLGDRKNQTIYPSIEVRGTLIPTPDMQAADHPIPIVLSDEDVERILEGRYLSKIYFLEDPDRALNGAQPLGIPLELSTASESEAFKEARSRGRMMIVVRAGERLWTKEELAFENVPGTILTPGMKAMPLPAAPPRILHCGIPLYDPLLGPAIPNQECLHDGGDGKRPLGIGKENRLYGLDPSDTAIEFTTPKGRQVKPSNRVCICIPRYAAMRTEMVASSNVAIRGPRAVREMTRRNTLSVRLPSLSVAKFEQSLDATGQARLSGVIGESFALTKDTFTGRLAGVFSVNGLQVAAQVREPEDLTTYPGCETLILQKRMEPAHPKQIGDVVTFFLRYQNPTNQPMTDVVVSDSLTGRLEYIEGTAKSDRATTFTATPNEAGSTILRWSIDGKLLSGQSGIISFKARIR